MLADSGTQAIDLICRYLLQPGDTVLVDDPCYFNFQAVLLTHRVKLVGVPYTHTGPDLEAFARAASEHAPKLYISNAGLHNPTGGSMTPATAHRLLKLAEAHGVTLVEDNIFGDFHPSPTRFLPNWTGSTASCMLAVSPRHCLLQPASAISPDVATGSTG